MKSYKYIVLLITITIYYSCNNIYTLKKNPKIVFPECISPIYYLDTIHINNPLLVIVDSLTYVVPKKIMEEEISPDSLIINKNVVRYLPDYSYLVDSYDVYKKSKLRDIAEINDFIEVSFTTIIDTISDRVKVYKFKYEPKSFILILIVQKATPIFEWNEELKSYSDDNITDVIFSKEYVLAVIPIFDKRDRKLIINNECHFMDSIQKIFNNKY